MCCPSCPYTKLCTVCCSLLSGLSDIDTHELDLVRGLHCMCCSGHVEWLQLI